MSLQFHGGNIFAIRRGEFNMKKIKSRVERCTERRKEFVLPLRTQILHFFL
jgi:hypothetical protein